MACKDCGALSEPVILAIYPGHRRAVEPGEQCRECQAAKPVVSTIAASETRIKPSQRFSIRLPGEGMNTATYVMNAMLILHAMQGKDVPSPCRCEGCPRCEGKAHYPAERKSRKTEFFIDTKKSLAGKGEKARRVGFVCCYCRHALGEIGDPTAEDGKYCEVMGHRLGPPSGLQKAKSGRRTPWPPPVQNTGQTPSNSASRASGSPRATASAPTQSLPLQSFFTSGRKSA